MIGQDTIKLLIHTCMHYAAWWVLYKTQIQMFHSRTRQSVQKSKGTLCSYHSISTNSSVLLVLNVLSDGDQVGARAPEIARKHGTVRMREQVRKLPDLTCEVVVRLPVGPRMRLFRRQPRRGCAPARAGLRRAGGGLTKRARG
jgi:hypothetical protein